jgi:hypothetical protein
MASRGDPIPAADRPVSTLHLAQTRTVVHARQCACLASATRAPPRDVVVVGLASSPARWLDQLTAAVDGDIDRATFVIPDDADWRAGDPRARLESTSPPGTDVRVASVASPGNLTDVGVTLTEELKAYESRDARTDLCFQSLTVLLQYASLDEVYRFLHALLANLDAADATGHFHLHEDAYDERTVASLRPLFDRVCGDCADD